MTSWRISATRHPPRRGCPQATSATPAGRARRRSEGPPSNVHPNLNAVSSGPNESERLERYLIAHGADPDELHEAIETGTRGPLALELALRSPGDRVPFAEAVEEAGLEPADAG